MMAFERVVVVEQERQRVVDTHGREMPVGPVQVQPENLGKEGGGYGLVVRRHDRMVERDGHLSSLSRNLRAEQLRVNLAHQRRLEASGTANAQSTAALFHAA